MSRVWSEIEYLTEERYKECMNRYKYYLLREEAHENHDDISEEFYNNQMHKTTCEIDRIRQEIHYLNNN